VRSEDTVGQKGTFKGGQKRVYEFAGRREKRVQYAWIIDEYERTRVDIRSKGQEHPLFMGISA
jgi:hypothetical protein